jgi:hypothetical protein
MSVEVSTIQYNPITLAAGANATYWFTWAYGNGNSVFDTSHWYWMSAVARTMGSPPGVPPDHASLQTSAVEIVSQYHYSPARQLTANNLGYWVSTFHNLSSTSPVTFYPTILVAPAID